MPNTRTRLLLDVRAHLSSPILPSLLQHTLAQYEDLKANQLNEDVDWQIALSYVPLRCQGSYMALKEELKEIQGQKDVPGSDHSAHPLEALINQFPPRLQKKIHVILDPRIILSRSSIF